MRKAHYKSIATMVIMLLILAISVTGCGKKSDDLNEQIEEMLGPKKTNEKVTTETENVNEQAVNPPAGVSPAAVDTDDTTEAGEKNMASAEEAVGNPIFVKGFSPNGQSSVMYDFYYLDIETGEMNLFFSFESKDKSFHEDIKKRISIRDFTGDTRTYDPIIRSDLLFNEDMTAIAVQWRENDQSFHVGWIDADGNVTDVTDKVYSTNSDFDILPNNQYPLFGPDNSLWFYDYNMQSYRKYIIDTGKVYDSDGQLNMGSTDILRVIYGDDRMRYHNIGSGSLEYSRKSIQKYNYTNGNDQRIDLIPDTDWSIQNVAYSGGKIVFDAVRGDQYKVFMIDNMNGVSEPKTIYSEAYSYVGDNPMLLFWRDPELRGEGAKLAQTDGEEKAQNTYETTTEAGQPAEGKEAFFNCGKIYVDSDRLLHTDEKFFGMTYDEIGRELNISIAEPVDFPGWGMELESSTINVDGVDIVLVFQDDKLAIVDYEYQGVFDEDQWEILCKKSGINGKRDTFDDYKDRGLLDPAGGTSYYYINYDYEQNGRGDILIQKYYWRGMKWD